VSLAPLLLVTLAACALAFANGANDNVKGVATLIGAGRLSPRAGIAFGTGATLLGSLTAMALAGDLLRRFGGRGIVGEELAGTGAFGLTVGGAAALTVLVATWLGLPVSTTHALVGALAGIGLATGTLRAGPLGAAFLAPLLVSPLVAFAVAGGLYPLLRRARLRLGVNHRTCVCVAAEPGLALSPAGAALASPGRLRVVAADSGACAGYDGEVVGVGAQRLLDSAHLLTAGALSFARGLNDTPKVAALLLVGSSLGSSAGLAVTGAVMAAGGLLLSRRVAETMSYRITPLNDGQAFTGNLTAAVLVVVASRYGLPVSTTHVSCGALFGIGAVHGQARWKVVATILGSWVATLPLAAVVAAALWMLVR
jgi:PiT family inorganic phosphate transporter